MSIREKNILKEPLVQTFQNEMANKTQHEKRVKNVEYN